MLSTSLLGNTTLTHLHLNSNSLSGGCGLFYRNIEPSAVTPLQHLSLAFNDLQSEDVTLLCEALASNSTLK